MMKQACCVMLIVLGNCGIANSSIVFSIQTVPSSPTNYAEIGPSLDSFTFDSIRNEIDNVDINNPPILTIPSLPPKSQTEFEIIMDYFDGGRTQTLTNGSGNNLGLAFTSLSLGNANGETLLLSLSSAEVLKTPPSEFYTWTPSATLNQGSKKQDAFFDEQTQSRNARVASVRATYRTEVGQNLFLFKPTKMTLEGNWYVNDQNGRVNLRISVVPEPSSIVVGMGAFVGLCLMGRHRKRNSVSAIA